MSENIKAKATVEMTVFGDGIDYYLRKSGTPVPKGQPQISNLVAYLARASFRVSGRS